MSKKKQLKYTISHFRSEFPNDDVCLEYIFRHRFSNLVCNQCNAKNSFYRVSTRKCYSCSHCGNQIHPLTGTIFHKSSTKLVDWFHSIYLFSSKDGISAKELERQLGVTYKTAWRITKRVKSLIKDDNQSLDKIDETYIDINERSL